MIRRYEPPRPSARDERLVEPVVVLDEAEGAEHEGDVDEPERSFVRCSCPLCTASPRPERRGDP